LTKKGHFTAEAPYQTNQAEDDTNKLEYNIGVIGELVHVCFQANGNRNDIGGNPKNNSGALEKKRRKDIGELRV
jgi:hypothetical protein